MRTHDDFDKFFQDTFNAGLYSSMLPLLTEQWERFRARLPDTPVEDLEAGFRDGMEVLTPKLMAMCSEMPAGARGDLSHLRATAPIAIRYSVLRFLRERRVVEPQR